MEIKLPKKGLVCHSLALHSKGTGKPLQRLSLDGYVPHSGPLWMTGYERTRLDREGPLLPPESRQDIRAWPRVWQQRWREMNGSEKSILAIRLDEALGISVKGSWRTSSWFLSWEMPFIQIILFWSWEDQEMKITETLDVPTGHPGCRLLAMVWTREQIPGYGQTISKSTERSREVQRCHLERIHRMKSQPRKESWKTQKYPQSQPSTAREQECYHGRPGKPALRERWTAPTAAGRKKSKEI